MDEIKVKVEYSKGKIRMALDACYRALCGLEQGNLDYAVMQCMRVREYAHDAQFAADLADVLKANVR